MHHLALKKHCIIGANIMKVLGNIVLPLALAALLRPSLACDASSLITRHEGKRLCVYTDTTGHKTVGVGYNLDQGGARSEH